MSSAARGGRGRVAVRRTGAGIAALALIAAVAGGCTSPRNVLGPRESPCFKVLPAAVRATGGSARLRGVRYLSPRALLALRRRRPAVPPQALPPGLRRERSRSLCLVGFSGRFTLSSVTKGFAPRAGPWGFAVVVADPSTGAVVATVLFRRAPLRFSRP